MATVLYDVDMAPSGMHEQDKLKCGVCFQKALRLNFDRIPSNYLTAQLCFSRGSRHEPAMFGLEYHLVVGHWTLTQVFLMFGVRFNAPRFHLVPADAIRSILTGPCYRSLLVLPPYPLSLRALRLWPTWTHKSSAWSYADTLFYHSRRLRV